MTLTHIAAGGYRSLQNLILPIHGLTVICGANGSGKSNLYRALRLIVAAAEGRLVAKLAAEGGLPAALWAGPRRTTRAMKQGLEPIEGTAERGPVRLRLGFAGDLLSYAIELGYPLERGSAFHLDPQIKGEWIWAGGPFHPRSLLVQRTMAQDLSPFESLLTGASDPNDAPEVFQLRREILSWRFYDGFRTDAGAPARNSPIGTRCDALAGDGSDLPAALQTILEIGDGAGLQTAVADAFPGSSLTVDVRTPRFQVQLQQPGLLRPLSAAELSDGTLRYLLLLAALFSPRLPPLLVLNEPENSLHPDLLPPLARLIGCLLYTSDAADE